MQLMLGEWDRHLRLAAFKQTAKAHPNYGRATNMGSVSWWTQVIEQTFKPLIPSETELPPPLAPTLIHRFASKEGYELFSDVLPFFEQLSKSEARGTENASERRLVVGIVTNSDDRVPDILRSFGLNVSDLRHGATTDNMALPSAADFDFAIMSYDVGFEKPDRRIFDSAKYLGSDLLGTHQSSSASPHQLIYVGDELDKDAHGAHDAAWLPVLLDREHLLHTRTSGAPEDLPHIDSEDRLVRVAQNLGQLWALLRRMKIVDP